MAAALRLLLRQHAAARPSPMLRPLFPALYSKTAAAAAASLPAVRGAPLPPPRLREVTPRKAPPTPKGEPRCCKTVPSTMTDSTKSLLDKLKDLKDSRKSLQDMKKNMEEHQEMIREVLHDCKVANGLFSKRADELRKLLANMLEDYVKTLNMQDDHGKTHNIQDLYGKIYNMLDGCDKIENMQDDYDKDLAIHEARVRLIDEQVEMLSKELEDYLNALRRYHEMKRSTMKHVEKVAKVGAAVGLVGGLLLILAKI